MQSGEKGSFLLDVTTNADEVAQQLGEYSKKAPMVIKNALNATTRELREQLLVSAKKKYRSVMIEDKESGKRSNELSTNAARNSSRYKGGSLVTYTTKPGQHWDQVAKEVYGHERHSDFLMEHNFEWLDYFSFEPGIVLRTPPLPEERRDIPSWRR